MTGENSTHLICSGAAVRVGAAGDSTAPVAGGWGGSAGTRAFTSKVVSRDAPQMGVALSWGRG